MATSTINGSLKYFKPKTNAQTLNAIRKISTNQYQQRIPAATKENIQQVLRALEDNRPSWNEFTNALINRIGLEIFRSNDWQNPLSKFKKPDLGYGDTIEEIAVGLAEAYTYDVDRDYLERAIFGQERPEVRAAYHKINRQNFYKVTINDAILKRAFNDEYGISNYIAELMKVPSKSDEVDEYLVMTGLFREYFDAGGFFKSQVPNIGAPTSTAADVKFFLRRVREFADNFTFVTRHYNAAGMPVHADREDLELFITPEANAAMDVEALAAAFNIANAAVPSRVTVVPAHDFRIPGVQAVLTTRDFFIVADSLYEVTEQQNPVGLYTNHFLHHHQVVSTSLFVPAVIFYTGPGDTITIADEPVTGVSGVEVTNREGDAVTTVERGEVYHVAAAATTEGYNDAARVELSGQNSVHTFLMPVNGTLVVSPDETSDTLTLTATAVDNNEFTSTTTVTVSGDVLDSWPNPKVVAEADAEAADA